jgi:hypothetical protein
MERRIDFSQFKQLLATIENSEVAIRIRVAGEEWSDFSHVLLLSENAMILQQDGRRRIIMNLKNVAEFQIDKPHLVFEPLTEYEIIYS